MIRELLRFCVMFLTTTFLLSTCQQNSNVVSNIGNENTITHDSILVYNYEALAPLLQTKEQQTFVVNFWVMWCVPCVKELPYFQALADQHPDIKVILVSLDFPSEIKTKLKPFLKQKEIDLKVVVLDDPASNTWIDKIDPNWSGSIPFTIIFNNHKRAYFEQSFESVEALENQINQIINNQ